MKLELEAIKVDEHIAYKIVKDEYCCESMRMYKNIDIDEDYAPSPHLAIRHTFNENCYGDEFEVIEYESIKFCPFCGEKIVVAVVGTKDFSVQYEEKSKQADEYRKQARETDSKKQSEECVRSARDISKDLDFYLVSDSIHME